MIEDTNKDRIPALLRDRTGDVGTEDGPPRARQTKPVARRLRWLGFLVRRKGGEVATVRASDRADDFTQFGLPLSYTYKRRRFFTVSRFLFYFVFVLPSIVGTVYYGFIESNRYVSYGEMTIVDAEANSSIQTITPTAIGKASVGSLSSLESGAVQDYIQSRNMMKQLEEKINLRAIWDKSWVDWYSRLNPNASEEDMYLYYYSMIDVVFDNSSGLITFSVYAFTPEDAKKINDAIVSLSDDLVNKMAKEARDQSLLFADGEVIRTEKRLVDARLAVTRFRDQHGEFDPPIMGAGIDQIVIGIEGQLAQLNVQLNNIRRDVGEKSPQIIMLRSRIAALESQLDTEKGRLAQPSGARYSSLTEKFGQLMAEENFATVDYTGALGLQETARFEASRKHEYMVPFIAPMRPDAPPPYRRIEWIATVIIASFAIYGILALIIAAVREHRLA